MGHFYLGVCIILELCFRLYIAYLFNCNSLIRHLSPGCVFSILILTRRWGRWIPGVTGSSSSQEEMNSTRTHTHWYRFLEEGEEWPQIDNRYLNRSHFTESINTVIWNPNLNHVNVVHGQAQERRACVNCLFLWCEKGVHSINEAYLSHPPHRTINLFVALPKHLLRHEVFILEC